MKRIYGCILLITLFVGSIAGTAISNEDLHVVASTTWVGAMAEAAGVSNVSVLAPVEMRHPAEYDFRPGDIQKALEADYVLWAGYESFIPNLADAAGISEDRVIQVSTNNSPPNLEESVLELAAALHTVEAFKAWNGSLQELAADVEAAAREADTESIPVAVHFHQEQWIRWLGYDVKAVFGPGEITPGKVQEVIEAEPVMIVDNWHSAQGAMFADNDTKYVSLLNFPGHDETESLLDVLRYNAAALELL